MTVEYKHDPQMSYNVLEESETQYNIEMLGWMNKDKFRPSNGDLPNIVDVYIQLQNNKNKN